jgi:ATP-dependent exoDNAse (exonuclease V) beta subunit
MLDRAIRKLKSEGVAASDIVILGRRRLSNSCLAGAAEIGGFRIADLAALNGAAPPLDAIPYATIHGFKGLESPIAIIADVNDVTSADEQALLYIAMTRARSSLSLYLDIRIQALVETRLKALRPPEPVA